MKIFKPLNLSFLYKVFEAGRAFHFCGAVICMFPFQNTNRLFADPKIWKFAARELGKDAALDLVMPKPRGEVLVTGACYTGGNKASARKVHLRLGSIDKSLYVFGDRYWINKGSAAADISEPEPFDRMDLRYQNAFGGEGFDRNPVGKGAKAVIDGQGREHWPLPNVEYEKHLIGSPDDRPAPAGFGPLDMTWPQRLSKAGTYDQKWLANLFPGLAADIDMTFFNLAPDDQWIDGYFTGNEPFAVEGMHPELEVLVSKLPGFRTRMFMVRQEDGQKHFSEIETSLDTVWLFPHAERGILIYHGTAEIATDDAEDVLYGMVGYERIDDEPRPPEHYQEALDKRLDKEKRSYYDLYDQDLIPPGEASGWADLIKIDPDKKGPLAANMLRRAENEKQKALQKWAEAEASTKELVAGLGLDPSLVEFPPLPAQDAAELDPGLKSFDPEQLVKMVRENEAKAEKAKTQAVADAKAKEEQARAKIKAVCDRAGVDYDEVMAKAEAQQPKRPIQYAADFRDRIRQVRAGAEKHILDVFAAVGAPAGQDPQQPAEAAADALSPLQDVLDQLRTLDPDDPELAAKLDQVEKVTREMYRQHAQEFPEFKPPSPEDAQGLIDTFESLQKEGASFKDVDLAGINLAGRKLAGINLAGAFLEGADLSGADLSGAILTGAILAYANLTGAKINQAKMRRANLGKADLKQTDLAESDLKDAVLNGVDVTGASFAGCRLDGLQLIDATMEQADFSGASLKKATFIKPKLTGVSFRGANLFGATFIKARLKDVDFTEAQAKHSSFIGARFENPVFNRADFTRAAFISNVQLPGALFHYTVLDRSNFMGANLEGASLVKATLGMANLMSANLRQADLTGIVARGASFSKANLEGATLIGANLMEANLKGTRLTGADLRKANLYSAEVLRAVFGDTKLQYANLKMTKIKSWGREQE